MDFYKELHYIMNHKTVPTSVQELAIKALVRIEVERLKNPPKTATSDTTLSSAQINALNMITPIGANTSMGSFFNYGS